MKNHLSRLEIENYRGFDSLVLDELADVNVIVGKNNAGKTALFEALVLLGQPCHIDNSTAVNAVRGLAKVAGDTEETWGLLFHDRRLDRPVKIVGTTVAGQKRALTIRIGQGTDLFPERHDRTPEGKGTATLGLLQQKALRIDYKPEGGEEAWAIATAFANESVVIDSTTLVESWMVPHASIERLTTLAPDLYSEVVKGGLVDELVVGLRSIAPDITKLDLLTRAGQPTLFATLGNGPLLPLQVLGDGVARVASWLLSMLVAQDKMVLIDEIENGIHYSVLADVWEALLETAKARNLQLFVTTHSYEAIKALQIAHTRVLFDAPSIQLVRLDRLAERVIPVDYDEELLGAAVEMRAEVR